LDTSTTFLVRNFLARTRKEVLAKNFGVPESAFSNIPEKALYIFQAKVPGSLDGGS
jgi:oxalate decarboxylase